MLAATRVVRSELPARELTELIAPLPGKRRFWQLSHTWRRSKAGPRRRGARARNSTGSSSCTAISNVLQLQQQHCQ